MGLEDTMDPSMVSEGPADPNGFAGQYIVAPEQYEQMPPQSRGITSALTELFGGGQPSIPPEPVAPTTQPFAAMHEEYVSPESKRVIDAMEKGYGDKKFSNPVKAIRHAISIDDEEGIAKGHKKLIDLLDGNRTWREQFKDNYYGHNAQGQANRKIATDIVMNELLRPGSSGPPSVEEATRLGMIGPQELLPGSQLQIPPDPNGWQPHGGPPPPPMSANGFVPGSMLTAPQEQMFNARMASMGKGQAKEETPFNIDVQAQTAAYIEQTGQPPNKQKHAEIVAIARERVMNEPVKGGIQEQVLKGKIASEAASTDKTLEQTKTEQLIRPHQIAELQAKTTNNLAFAHQAMTNASDAVRKGDMAVYRAELEQAKAANSVIHGQLQAVAFSMAEGELKQADKAKLMNYVNQLYQTGIEISHKAGILGLDMGRPNIGINEVGPAGGKPGNPPEASQQAPQGVDPFAFAPIPPGGRPQYAPSPQQQSFTAPAPPPAMESSPFVDARESAYDQLRRSGLSHAAALKKLNGKK